MKIIEYFTTEKNDMDNYNCNFVESDFLEFLSKPKSRYDAAMG